MSKKAMNSTIADKILQKLKGLSEMAVETWYQGMHFVEILNFLDELCDISYQELTKPNRKLTHYVELRCKLAEIKRDVVEPRQKMDLNDIQRLDFAIFVKYLNFIEIQQESMGFVVEL
jgi:hypothetical protein